MRAPTQTLIFISLTATPLVLSPAPLVLSPAPLVLSPAPLVLSPAQATEPAFQRIQNTIFTPVCTTCHAGIFAPHHLRLDPSNSYRLLVGVQSAEVPSLQRVKSGDPDASYLIQKIEGHAKEGLRMPAAGPPLSSKAIQLIRQWILQGAPAAK